MKIIVTTEILEANPELGSLGYMVGDEINVVLNVVPLGDENKGGTAFDDGDPTGGGTGGERPPTGPRRP